MPNYSVLKKAETETAYINLCDDGIVRVTFKKDKEIHPIQVQENFDAYNRLIDGKMYSFLYLPEDTTVIYSAEGLQFSKENSAKAFQKICTAVVIKSLAHRLIANFYNLTFNAKFPYKVFSNYEEAESWCIELYKKHHNR
jgi:hypothetical protein